MDAPQQPITDTMVPADQQPPQEQRPPQEQQLPHEQQPPQVHRQSTDHTPSANLGLMATEDTKLKPSYHNGYSSDSHAHYSSRPAEFSMPARAPTPQDAEQPRHAFLPMNPQPQPPAMSRPSSGLSSSTERHPASQQQPESSQKNQPAKNSVVIKVGMVGDAQIGKTSLMVKYVEGSWDEDYIQTLGVSEYPPDG